MTPSSFTEQPLPRIRKARFIEWHQAPAIPMPTTDAGKQVEFFHEVLRNMRAALDDATAGCGEVGIAKEFKQRPNEEVVLRVRIKVRKGCSTICDVLLKRTPNQITIAIGNGVRRPVDTLRNPHICWVFVLAGLLAVFSNFGRVVFNEELGWAVFGVGFGLAFLPWMFLIHFLEMFQIKREDDARLKATWHTVAIKVQECSLRHAGARVT